MAKVNTAEIISNSKFNRFHLGLAIWGFLIILFDGYDLAVYGTVVPVLIKEWNLTTVEAGAMGSYGLFGMMFGAIFFGILADRIGRKAVIIITLTLFSLFTLLCGFAETPTMLSTYRFLAGLGLGGIMPNVIALVTDYAPKSTNIKLVSIMLTSYSVGGILAPLFGIFLMSTFGWEAIFWFAGLPLLALPLLMRQLPEAANHLIKRGKKEKLLAILSKVNPDITFDKKDEFMAIKGADSKVPVIGLFKEKRALSTFMFWIAFFSCLLMVYGLNTWLPNLMIKAGYALNSSLAFLIVLQGGAIIGTLFISQLCEKYGSKKILMPTYISGAVALTLLGFGGHTFFIMLLVAVAGFATIGAQYIINAYLSQYYPGQIRSTALGVASGVGRTGGMLGPIFGGFLLSLSLPIHLNFMAFAIPGVIAAIAITLVPEKYAEYNKLSTKKEEVPSMYSIEPKTEDAI